MDKGNCMNWNSNHGDLEELGNHLHITGYLTKMYAFIIEKGEKGYKIISSHISFV